MCKMRGAISRCSEIFVARGPVRTRASGNNASMARASWAVALRGAKYMPERSSAAVTFPRFSVSGPPAETEERKAKAEAEAEDEAKAEAEAEAEANVEAAIRLALTLTSAL